MTALGGTRIDCDFSPFLKIARLLYDGPWVAERYAAIGHFLEESPNSLLPVTKGIIGSGKSYSAADLFRAQDQLRILERECYKIWEMADVLITPTVGTTYRISEIASNPNTLNTNLGYYTNFVNLLDLCAVAVPTGFSDHNLPFGITLAAPPNSDEVLLSLASRIHSKAELPPGIKETSFPCCDALETNPANRFVDIAVCGAHMRNLPLNFQLTDIGGKYLETRKTIDKYRLYALPGGPPHRPGLIKAQPGASIEVEIWRLSKAGFGDFVSKIPSPLGIGQVELDNGDQVCGFLCEAYAIRDARDITEFGTWRKFITQTESP